MAELLAAAQTYAGATVAIEKIGDYAVKAKDRPSLLPVPHLSSHQVGSRRRFARTRGAVPGMSAQRHP